MKHRRGNVTWYINPASILQAAVSVFATFKLLDVYSKKETGEGVLDGAKAGVESLKEKWSDHKN